MANYITKFKTQADYNTQKYKLDYPNTSYIEGTDEVVLVNAMPTDYAIAWLDSNNSVIDVSQCSATLTRPRTVRGENVYGVRWGDCQSLTVIGENAFQSCSHISGSFVIPSNITAIGNSAFYYCQNMTITLPDNLLTIGASAFTQCANTEWVVPDSVTTIGDYAFTEGPATSLTIGTGCTSLGMCPVNWNTNMAEITIKATTPPTVPGSFRLTYASNDSTIQIYVPAASVDAYKAATGWSRYSSQINAITE